MTTDFLEFYDLNYDSIYRYTYVRVGNKWDAEDIVSEVFRKAFEHHGAVRTNSRAWLFSIARNSINDHYRRSKHKTVELDAVFCVDPGALEDPLERIDELDCLKKALDSLEDEDYDIISLRYFSDLKYEDLAAILGKQSDYLRVKVSRLVKKLGSMLIRCLEGKEWMNKK